MQTGDTSGKGSGSSPLERGHSNNIGTKMHQVTKVARILRLMRVVTLYQQWAFERDLKDSEGKKASEPKSSEKFLHPMDSQTTMQRSPSMNWGGGGAESLQSLAMPGGGGGANGMQRRQRSRVGQMLSDLTTRLAI